MTKSELKTGMVVTLANGNNCMVFKDISTGHISSADVLVDVDDKATWLKLSNYNEDMTHKDICCKRYNIVEVVQIEHPYNLIKPNRAGYSNRKLLWKRPEKKKYTYAQLREILGEEFEVVG